MLSYVNSDEHQSTLTAANICNVPSDILYILEQNS
uniref:Uncharacterized protein n=1 Tax=Anguilla anguilla TaxID=7936 RepID=A0A0E9R4V0_ANGAN